MIKYDKKFKRFWWLIMSDDEYNWQNILILNKNIQYHSLVTRRYEYANAHRIRVEAPNTV